MPFFARSNIIYLLSNYVNKREYIIFMGKYIDGAYRGIADVIFAL